MALAGGKVKGPGEAGASSFNGRFVTPGIG
jgi:hypothetical protein